METIRDWKRAAAVLLLVPALLAQFGCYRTQTSTVQRTLALRSKPSGATVHFVSHDGRKLELGRTPMDTSVSYEVQGQRPSGWTVASTVLAGLLSLGLNIAQAAYRSSEIGNEDPGVVAGLGAGTIISDSLFRIALGVNIGVALRSDMEPVAEPEYIYQFSKDGYVKDYEVVDLVRTQRTVKARLIPEPASKRGGESE